HGWSGARGQGSAVGRHSSLVTRYSSGAQRMIGRIHGKLVEKHPPQIVVDVGGGGYDADVPMSTFYNLPATGADVALYTHLAVREDAHQLFGFATEAERHAFRQLLKISGVGARTALSVLSGLSVSDLRDAVVNQDSGR